MNEPREPARISPEQLPVDPRDTERAVKIAKRLRKQGIGIITDDKDLSASFGIRGKSNYSALAEAGSIYGTFSYFERFWLPKIPKEYLNYRDEPPMPFIWHFPVNMSTFEQRVRDAAEADKWYIQESKSTDTPLNPKEFIEWFKNKLGNPRNFSELYVWGFHGSTFFGNAELMQELTDAMKKSSENTKAVLAELFGPEQDIVRDILTHRQQVAIVDNKKNPKEVIHSFPAP